MLNLTDNELHILRHSLGIDDAGNWKIYRNRYVSDPDNDLKQLVAIGLLHDHGAMEVYGSMHAYSVTEAGRAVVIESMPRPERLTRSQRRYRDYLTSDCGLSFSEYLKSRLCQNR